MATARLTLAALLLTGCPAERLGVPVPTRGMEALSQEDLQRDVFHLLEPGDAHRRHQDAAAWVAQRFEQMKLEPIPVPVEGAVCGLRRGASEPVLLFLAQPNSAGAEQSALPDAALISLAKSTDGLGPPRRGLLFCSAPRASFSDFQVALPTPWADLAEVIHIQELGGPELAIDAPTGQSPSHRSVHTGHEQFEPERDGMERLNYERIAEHLRAVHRQLLAPEVNPAD